MTLAYFVLLPSFVQGFLLMSLLAAIFTIGKFAPSYAALLSTRKTGATPASKRPVEPAVDKPAAEQDAKASKTDTCTLITAEKPSSLRKKIVQPRVFSADDEALYDIPAIARRDSAFKTRENAPVVLAQITKRLFSKTAETKRLSPHNCLFDGHHVDMNKQLTSLCGSLQLSAGSRRYQL